MYKFINNIITSKTNTSNMITLEKGMIKYFFEKSKKSNNGKDNDIRENIILHCLNNTVPNDFLKDDKWQTIYNGLRKCFEKQYNIDNTNYYTINQLGGRQNNYDFVLTLFKDFAKTHKLKEHKIEFKFNQSLYKMPQLGQWSVKQNYFENDTSYPEFYYDNHFSKFMTETIKINPELKFIDKESYLNAVCQSSSKELKPYKEYYKLCDKFTKDCKALAKSSVKSFLETYKIDATKFSEIFKLQLEKDFLFYDLKKKEFIFSKFLETDFEIIFDKPITVKSTRVEYFTKSGNIMIIRLDWKNGTGICNPAIKLLIKKYSAPRIKKSKSTTKENKGKQNKK